MKLRLLKYLIVLAMGIHIEQCFAVDSEASASFAKSRVGMLLTLSGEFAAAGSDCKRGIEAALKTAKLVPFEVVYGDSQNSPAQAISEFRKMAEVDKVLAVYTHRGPIGIALNPISLQLKLPLLGAVGPDQFATANEFAIQTWPAASDEGSAVAEALWRKGMKSAALIYSEDEWTTTVSKSFIDSYEKRGGTLLFKQAVLPTDSDIRSVLLQIKSKAPDVIYINTLMPQIAPIVRQVKDLKFETALFSNFYAAKKEVIAAAGAQRMENISYLELDTDLPELRKLLSVGVNESIPGLTVASYVATLILMDAFDHNKILIAQDLQQALLKQSEIMTPDRQYRIENRVVKFPLALKTIKNGEGVVIK